MQDKRVALMSAPAKKGSFLPRGETRRSLFAKMREEVEILHAFGLKHLDIAAVLEITMEDARALCPSTRGRPLTRVLSRRALTALLRGRHAAVGGQTLAERAQHLTKIASAYTEQELANEPRIGAVTVMEIALWLNDKGLSFRPSGKD